MKKSIKRYSKRSTQKITKKKGDTHKNINYRQYSKKIIRLYNFYKKVCEKRRPMNTKAIILEHHPANPFTHISLTNDSEFITKYSDILKKKSCKMLF